MTDPPVHASLVAAHRGGRWRGVLLLGASGRGKSDLALRLIDAGWRLVADDRVALWRSGGALFGRPPAILAGLLEVRGLGVLATPALPQARIVLAAQAVDHPERMAEPGVFEQLGVPLPSVALTFPEPSAPSKLERALADALRQRL